MDWTVTVKSKTRMADTIDLKLEYSNGSETFIRDYHIHFVELARYGNEEAFLTEKKNEFVSALEIFDNL